MMPVIARWNACRQLTHACRAIVTRKTHDRAEKVTWQAAQLPDRAVLELHGVDSRDYLQNLITNDVRHLEDDSKNCIYSFMLNHQGRVTGELFVYRARSHTDLLIECDRVVLPDIQQNLNRFKLKKQVKVKKRDDLAVWSVFPSRLSDCAKMKDFADTRGVLVNDPRLPGLGLFRAVAKSDLAVIDIVADRLLEQLTDTKLYETDAFAYTKFRLQNGLAEGSIDHSPGNTFPLEANGDFLNAISFFKGCYVGQELTARTYHTGVTRKRFMPLKFEPFASVEPKLEQLRPDQRLVSRDGKKRLGKLKSFYREYAIGVVYFDELEKYNNELYIENEGIKLVASRPVWWPDKDHKSVKNDLKT